VLRVILWRERVAFVTSILSATVLASVYAGMWGGSAGRMGFVELARI
jgi:hypothetical protein